MRHEKHNNTVTAIVTGASTGIGYAISQRFLDRGINVIMNARTEADLVAAYEKLGSPANAAYVVGDISDRHTGKALVDKAIEKFSGVDIVINNAGIFQPKAFLETEEADLDRFFSINFKGAYFITQAAVPEMKKRGGGSIVNIGTTLLEHAIAGLPVTAAMASKAALHSLTEQLASELGEDNIRVSTIATGIIETPLHVKHGVDDAESLAGLHLLNRIGTTEDMADAVEMLVNNNFITGTTLRVDGGHAAGHRFA